MDRVFKKVAVVEGAPSAAVQAMFRHLVARWRPAMRIVGVVEERSVMTEGRVCRAGELRSIAGGMLYPMFEAKAPGPAACDIEGTRVVSACDAVRRDIADGCDLVVLSKFGKLEAAGQGLMAAFAAAVEAEIPLLTTVSPACYEAWERFAAPLAVTLPATPEAADDWLRQAAS